MRIFETDSKVNFVDENNVLLGYDLDQCCCESVGWFLADTPGIPDALVNGRWTELDDNANQDLSGWTFDIAYFKEEFDYRLDEGGIAIFRIVKGDQSRYIHLYNSHNGYYSHGFRFTDGGEHGVVLRDSSI